MKKVATIEIIERVDSILDRMVAISNKDEVVTMDVLDALYKEYDEIKAEYDLFDQVFEENGMQGVRNAAGKILVPALYKEFSETYTYKRYGYIMPVPACDFSGKYALVKCDGKGTPMCGFEYDMIKFMFGSCALYKCWKRVGDNYLTGVIDGDGNVLVPCEMDEVYGISNGFATVEKDGKFGVITTRSVYIEPLYDEVEENDGLLKACKDGMWGYIGSNGEFVPEDDDERMRNSVLLGLYEC